MKSKLKSRRPHYTKALTSIISDPRINDKSLRIYLLIKSFEGRSHSAYPTVATLMKLSGSSKSAVLRAVADLQNIGLVKVQKVHMGNARPRNLYLIDDEPYIARIPLEILRLRKSNFKGSIGPLVTPMHWSAGDTPSKTLRRGICKYAFSDLSFSGMNHR